MKPKILHFGRSNVFFAVWEKFGPWWDGPKAACSPAPHTNAGEHAALGIALAHHEPSSLHHRSTYLRPLDHPPAAAACCSFAGAARRGWCCDRIPRQTGPGRSIARPPRTPSRPPSTPSVVNEYGGVARGSSGGRRVRSAWPHGRRAGGSHTGQCLQVSALRLVIAV